MTGKSRYFSPTSLSNIKYITATWKRRNELDDFERKGFCHFFYLTICGHIENLLSSIVQERISSIRHMLVWHHLPPKHCTIDGTQHECDLKPVYESLLNIISNIEKVTENATLNQLIEQYNKTFDKKLKEVIGTDIYDDLDALASLRNLFAHGRDFFIDFDVDINSRIEKVVFDKNPLQKPSQRLYHADIINNLNITTENYHDFQSYFYSDDALLYFYKAVQEAENKLAEHIEFLPEQPIKSFMRLQDLES